MKKEDRGDINGRWVWFDSKQYPEIHYYKWDDHHFVTICRGLDDYYGEDQWVYWTQSTEITPMPEGEYTLDERKAVAMMLAKMEA